MRLVVRCQLERETACPVNHQYLLSGLVYRLLGTSDAEYAGFLHDEGYRLDDGPKRFKLFVFSGLRAGRRRVVGETLWLGPGLVTWFVASPVEAFLTHCATGLLASGALALGEAVFPIVGVEALASPDFSTGEARFTCLTPIVASVPVEQDGKRGTYYLRPADGETFSEAVRRNLICKYQTLFGKPPADDRFRLVFDPDYLRHHRDGTKKITFKSIDIIGAQCPFTASGSPELLRVGYECGLGEKNSNGFGMVEVKAAESA